MKKEFVLIRHFDFSGKFLWETYARGGNQSGIERSVFRGTGDIDSFTIRAGDTDKASIDFRRVVLCNLVIYVVFAALIDVDDQHVADGACLFDQGLLQ